MELLLERKYPKESYVMGSLFIKKSPHKGGDSEGTSWFCNTLEPPLGSATEAVTAGSGKAIPSGRYKVVLAWSQRFQEYLPRLEDIPPKQGGLGGLGARSGILIHAGNSPHDTIGCILVGRNTQKGKVLQSRDTLSHLIALLRNAHKEREEVTIEIK